MADPPGTVDLSTRNKFGSYVQGGSTNQVRDQDGGIYVECTDRNPAPWNGQPGQMPAECVQVQAQHVFPYGVRKFLDFEIEFLALTNQPNRDWKFVLEDHLNAAGTSCRIALNLQTINGEQHMQVVYTPYGFARRYPEATRRKVKPGTGEKTRVTIEFLPHVSAGYIAVYYDGVKVFSFTGQTSQSNDSSYMKDGFYRPIGVNGLDAAIIRKMKVYTSNPITDPGEPPPPPPPTGDTVKPVIVRDEILAPVGPGPFPLDAVPYDFPVIDLDPGLDIWFGVGGTGTPGVSVKLEGPGRHRGVLDCTKTADGKPSGIEPGEEVTLYIAASDDAGNDADAWSTRVRLGVAPEPPPPPPPTLPTAEGQDSVAKEKIRLAKGNIITVSNRLPNGDNRNRLLTASRLISEASAALDAPTSDA